MKKVVAAVLLTALVVAALAMQKKEYDRVPSPDGAFTAIAEYRAFRAWLPGMPGGSGDKPGSVRVISKDGVAVGEARVPMVSFVRDIRWSKEEASIAGIVSWKLPPR
jgi:hypothetical protein